MHALEVGLPGRSVAGPAIRWGGTLLACAALVAPAAARAGTYQVWSCRGPSGAPVSSRAWVRTAIDASAPDLVRTDTCDAGGSLSVALAPGTAFAHAEAGALSFVAPGSTSIVGYTLFRHLAVASPDAASKYAAFVQEGRDGGSVGDFGCTAVCTVGDGSDPLSLANSFGAQSQPLDRVDLLVACLSSTCTANASTAPASADLYSSEVTLLDSSPPAVPSLSGAVAAGAAVSGQAPLTVSSVDSGSGIASVSLSVDHGPPTVFAPSGCQQPYVDPVPCPLVFEHTFSLDTPTLTPGSHTASGSVVDAAGNATPWGPVRFIVVPTGAVSLKVASRQGTIPLRADGRGIVSGRLRTSSGQPIAAAKITIAAAPRGVTAARPRTLGTVTTDRHGAFSLPVRLPGAYDLTARYAPAAGAGAAVQARTRTPISVSLHARPLLLHRDQVATLTGSLRGAGRSTTSAAIQLQVRSGHSWIPVTDLRPAANGNFRFRHRFVRLGVDTIFTFRAVVRAQLGWPWPQTISHSVDVRVNVP